MLDFDENEATVAEKPAPVLPALAPERPEPIDLRALAQFICDAERFRIQNEATGRSGR